MEFNVGPYLYSVRITAERMENDQGVELLGEAVLEDFELVLSHKLKPKARLNVLLHELMHAWEFHFPPPRDEEQRACMFAAVCSAAMRDLKRQGGEARLMAMFPAGEVLDREQLDEQGTVDAPEESPLVELPLGALVDTRRKGKSPGDAGGRRYVPLDVVESWQTAAIPDAARAQCGKCETIVPGGMIKNDPPGWSYAAGGLVMTRRLYCPHCNHVQEWDEGASSYGKPNGAVLGEPRIIDDRELVEEFLTEVPEAVGLLVE